MMPKRITMRFYMMLLVIATIATASLLVGCSQHANEPDTDATNVESTLTPISVEDAEAQTGISADGEGVEYEKGELVVLFWPENTVEDLEATLAQAPSVKEKQITEDMLADGTMSDGVLHRDTLEGPAVMVHTAEGATVVQAVAELEQCDLVLSAGVIEIGVLDGWGTAGS